MRKVCDTALLMGACLAMLVGDVFADIKSERCNPYYVSTKADKVNAHVGPGRIYRIVYEYVQRCLPLEVIARYDNWRKVKDHDG
jgi:SH3-like domain-containing protein